MKVARSLALAHKRCRMSIKVLLADDSAVVRRGMRQLLAAEIEIEIVGEAADFRQTIRLMDELNPQIIVLDLHMPDGTQATLLDLKSHLKHGSRLVAISVFNDEETKTLVESLGTVPLLDKMELHQKLIPTILELASA